MAKKIQQQGLCIFCNGFPLSKEHIWANWLREFLPYLDTTTRHGVVHVDGRFGYGKLHRPGDVRSQRLRVVCRDCNSGWMSRNQNDAKPIIANMLRDGILETDQDSLRKLASWAVMFTLIYERAEPALANSTVEQRRRFMEENQPPNGWTVYLCRASVPSHHLAAWRRAGGDPTRQDPTRDVQATLINLGSWALLTTYASNGHQFSAEQFGMIKIWDKLSSMMTLDSELQFAQLQELMFAQIPDLTGVASDLSAAFSAKMW